MPHWHDQNPWKDKIVYVPIERLAECVAGDTIEDVDGVVKPYDVPYVLRFFAQGGDKLDAYILPQPKPQRHSIGVRYGAEGHEYFSPHNRHPDKTEALLAEFRTDV